MGLRDTVKMTVEFPGFKDTEFVKRNLDFISYQIDLIKPQVLITLGKYAAEMVTYLSLKDLNDWANWQALKAGNVGLKHNIKFNNHICTCVALEHPSMRNSNVKRRVYVTEGKEYRGNAAEVKMLEYATNQIK